MSMNFSSIFNYHFNERFQEYFADPGSQGCFLVLIEMSLSLIGTVLNLIVLIPVLEIEELSNSTLNILMANLSLGNLVATVFVKLVGVVYHGYALAASKWDIQIVFCTIYTITSRLSWAMFPFTMVAICGVGIAKRAIELLTVWEKSELTRKRSLKRKLSRLSRNSAGSSNSLGSRKSKSKSVEIVEDVQEEEEFEEEGFTKIQKGALGFVWVASLIYACLTDKVLSKNQNEEVICSVREDLSLKFNIMSVLMIIAFPILCLILWPLGHLILDLLSCVKGIVIMSANPSANDEDAQANCCGDESDSCVETILVFGFAVIFLVIYPTSMIITEFYFSEIDTMFAFMLLKYCVGSMHLVLSPACILIIKRDIRKASKDIYMKRTAKAEDTPDITIKELQERLEKLRAMGRDDDQISEAELRRIIELQTKK